MCRNHVFDIQLKSDIHFKEVHDPGGYTDKLSFYICSDIFILART